MAFVTTIGTVREAAVVPHQQRVRLSVMAMDELLARQVPAQEIG